MLATLRYVLLTALRDRLVIALPACLLMAVCGALLIASSALAEQNQFGLAFAGEATRLILALGMLSFITFHIRRMHETREIEAILARPISRASFVLSYFTAFAAIAVALALVTAALMAAAFVTVPLGLALWTLSLALEICIIVAMGLFCAMSLESATAALLAAMGLYSLARMAASFRFIIEFRQVNSASPIVNHGGQWLIQGLAMLMPRIDLFGQSLWLSQGPGGPWGARELLLQAGLYIPLLLAATVRDLMVRKF